MWPPETQRVLSCCSLCRPGKCGPGGLPPPSDCPCTRSWLLARHLYSGHCSMLASWFYRSALAWTHQGIIYSLVGKALLSLTRYEPQPRGGSCTLCFPSSDTLSHSWSTTQNFHICYSYSCIIDWEFFILNFGCLAHMWFLFSISAFTSIVISQWKLKPQRDTIIYTLEWLKFFFKSVDNIKYQ